MNFKLLIYSASDGFVYELKTVLCYCLVSSIVHICRSMRIAHLRVAQRADP